MVQPTPFAGQPGAPPPGADPVQAGFDRIVALASYALLFVSPFSFGATALGTLGLALFHGRDASSLAASHYRFQLRVLLVGLLAALLGLAVMAVGGGLLLGGLWSFVAVQAEMVAAAVGGAQDGRQTLLGGGLAIGSLLILGLAGLWILAASAFGFLRLALNRPIGRIA
jgi:uncharacterized membrane protein